MTDLIADLAEVRSKREAWAASLAEEAWNELALLAVNFTAHHAEIEAMARDARGEREQSWEVWQDDMPVAGSEDLPDALHYLAMYRQDGLVTLKRAVVYRETITPEQLAAMRDSAREGGE